MYTLLYADKNGNIFDAPGHAAWGRSGYDIHALDTTELIPLPEGADLMYLPGRMAMIREGLSPGLAVAAVLPAGYTRTHLPAYTRVEKAPSLPLFGYTAAALKDGEIYVAAVKSDEGDKWNPLRYNTGQLKKLVRNMLKRYPRNRIYRQLAKCSLEYHCCTAQNIFYARWEAGIPVSPVCNARCFGCISLQPAECCPSPQNRIEFVPSVQEIAEVMTNHLTDASEAIISFGQGCEGEPSLQADVVAEAIKQVRRHTAQGVININTNAGFTEGIKEICAAGLDSMRVSLISAREDVYHGYYRPINYKLNDVFNSVRIAKEYGVYISLNLLVFPGLTDREEEVESLHNFIAATGIDMIQMRNLNADPDEVMKVIPPAQSKAIGIGAFIEGLKNRFPALRIGSYSRYISGRWEKR
jgi:pyruvate-formate lyase-activating enzyme